MVFITADDRMIERCLERLVAQVESAGGTLATDLLLKCVEGGLSIEASPDRQGELLLTLPSTIMPRIERFKIHLEEDDFIISSRDPGATPETIGALETMLELYNLTHKAALHRQTASWPFLESHPELIEIILAGRSGPALGKIAQLAREKRTKDLVLETFLKSRTLGFRRNPAEKPEKTLMPIIDFFNHHPQGAAYQPAEQNGENVMLTIRKSQPDLPESRECYACYGWYDSLDVWLNYNFLSEKTSFVRSIPLNIDLPGPCKIKARAFSATQKHENLQPPIADLGLYLPHVIQQTEDTLEITFLLIPGPNAPRALRRVLGALLRKLNPAFAERDDLVALAEEQVLAGNVAYYTKLKEILATLELNGKKIERSGEDLMQLCNLQLSRIEKYKAYALPAAA